MGAGVLELEARELQVVRALDGGERDREILDREPGRVECRDLLVGAPTFGRAGQHCAELRDVAFGHEPRVDGVRELAAVGGLLPVVREEAATQQLPVGRLRLAGAVGAHQRHVLAGPERPLGQQHLVAGRHGHQQVGGQNLIGRRRDARAELLRDRSGAGGVDVPQEHVAAARGERARGRAAVHAGAHDGGRRRIGAAERLGGKHRRRARAKRRHRRGVEDCP